VTNSAPITLAQLFRYVRKNQDGSYVLPHQAAAIAEMELDIQQNGYAAAMRRDRPWFATWSQAGQQPPPSTAAAAPPARILQVPYYSQRDSAQQSQRDRTCFSSSCAMLLEAIKPGTLKGANGDDAYLAVVQRYGDTTEVNAQLQALASFGLRAQFTQRADFATIERSISKGKPVPVGYLHRGPVDAPAGGGHWAIVIGFDGDSLVLHDPWGEADLLTGATVSGNGRAVRYSRRNFGRRWMVEGPGTGWAIVAV
jgi:hypothetical protein